MILALLILISFIRDLNTIASKDSAISVVNALERIPTDWRVYGAIVILASLWTSWRFYLKTKLREKLEFEKEDTRRQGLNDRDWQAYSGLRERALSLRTRAGLILGGVFVFLFLGIYSIIFILPQIEGSDQLLKQERQWAIRERQWAIRERQRAIFQERFGKEFQAMSEGRYWLKIDDKYGNRSPSPATLVVFMRVNDIFPRNTRPIVATAKSGKFILIRDNGTGLSATDGGKTWKPKDLKLKQGEEISTAVHSNNGRHVLLASDRGSLFMSIDSAETWNQTNLKLKATEFIDTAVLSNDSQRVLLVSDEGSVFVSLDGAKSWNKANVKLGATEFIDTAVLSNDGQRVFACEQRRLGIRVG